MARIGAIAGGLLALGVVLAGGWFYSTVSEAPTPPTGLVEREGARSSVELPEVQAELLRMHWVDQAVRKRILDMVHAGETDGLGQTLRALRLSLLEDRVDEDNTARLKELVAEHGWLDAGRVGRDGAEAAFLIVQHADHDAGFQKKVLERLREAYEEGRATGQQVALLSDRVRVAEGEPQLYGTQARFREGKVTFGPIRDSANVDQRRSEMGLPPLSEYAEELRHQAGARSER